MLSDGVYASAEIPPTDSVLLWLGVGVPTVQEWLLYNVMFSVGKCDAGISHRCS